MKLFPSLSLLLLSCAFQASLAQQNVYEVARSMPETFSTLARAVMNAELVDALTDPGLDSTVFAPTNDAFVALNALNLPSANTRTLFRDPAWAPHLQDLLLYHVLGGSQVLAEDVTDGLTVTMLNGEDITFSVSGDGAVSINSAATVVAADVSASNGVIHVIDQVLAPSWVSNSIVDRAVAASNLGTLVDLVTLAELVDVLDGPGKYTVFAPTDDAFNALLSALNVGVEYFTQDNPTFLAEVLTYHVVPGIFDAEKLVDGVALRTLQGERVFFEASDDGTISVNGQEILGSALTNNGVVHIVGGVLAPSTPFPAATDDTLVDVAVGLPELFSTLVSLVTQADLVAFLSQPLSFTVFAPVNDAFGELDPELVAALQTRPYKMHLRSVLSYHVLEGVVFAEDIQDGMMAETLIGDSLTLSISEEGVFVNGDAQVVSADVSADNGVIHVIDKVLLPPWTGQTCTDVAASDEKLSTLVSLLSMVGFDDLLSRPGPFTVLAPVNEAFASFLDDINNDVAGLQQLEDRFGTVTNLLEYHLFDGIYDSEALKEEPIITTKFGYRVGFEFSDNELTVQGATFNTTDIVAGNGIIHIINGMSLP